MEEREGHELTDEAIRGAFLRSIESDEKARKKFYDAEFGSLDLSSLVLDSGDNESVVFRQTTFHGRLDLSKASVRQPLHFNECVLRSVRARDAEFEYDFACRSSSVGQSADFGHSRFLQQADFNRSKFEGKVVFDETDFADIAVFGLSEFEQDAEFSSAEFNRAYFDGAVFAGTVRLRDARFGGKSTFTDATFCSALRFDRTRADSHLGFIGVTFDDVATFSRASLDGIVEFDVQPRGDSAAIDLTDATLSAGYLNQPSDSVVLYDLTGARLGDVTLDLPSPAAFDRYRFYRTDFEDFQFTEYREALREHRWKIHEYVEPTENTTTDLELTYLKAKRGASSVGDNDDASQFFIREMGYRRRRYRERMSDSDLPARDRLGALSRWFTNGFLALVAGYGEKPQRVIATSLSVIVTSALLYPFEWIGGIRTAGGVYQYGSRPTLAAELAAFAYDSLYFSVVTFTTLGYGDSSPAGGLARLLASAEAVSGAFLAALFVFTLGRRVTR